MSQLSTTKSIKNLQEEERKKKKSKRKRKQYKLKLLTCIDGSEGKFLVGNTPKSPSWVVFPESRVELDMVKSLGSC